VPHTKRADAHSEAALVACASTWHTGIWHLASGIWVGICKASGAMRLAASCLGIFQPATCNLQPAQRARKPPEARCVFTSGCFFFGVFLSGFMAGPKKHKKKHTQITSKTQHIIQYNTHRTQTTADNSNIAGCGCSQRQSPMRHGPFCMLNEHALAGTVCLLNSCSLRTHAMFLRAVCIFFIFTFQTSNSNSPLYFI
jgi:hypothetical protein